MYIHGTCMHNEETQFFYNKITQQQTSLQFCRLPQKM